MDAEQVARNDAVFRDANEHIAGEAERLDAEEPLPFICECADPTCQVVIRLTREQYRHVRDDPTRFAIAPGHEDAAGAFARVAERHEGFWVEEKVGRAADAAADLEASSG